MILAGIRRYIKIIVKRSDLLSDINHSFNYWTTGYFYDQGDGKGTLIFNNPENRLQKIMHLIILDDQTVMTEYSDNPLESQVVYQAGECSTSINFDLMDKPIPQTVHVESLDIQRKESAVDIKIKCQLILNDDISFRQELNYLISEQPFGISELLS